MIVVIVYTGKDNPLTQILTEIQGLKEALSKMATQADIDALVTQVKETKDAIISAVGDSAKAVTDTVTIEHEEVMAEIAKVQAANPALDLSGLSAAVASLKDNITTTVTDEATTLKTAVEGIITPTP